MSGSRKSKRVASSAAPPTVTAGTAKEPLLGIAAIVVVALALRFWRLTADLPVVGDESIYLRWAEIVDNQGRWFVSLLDGKPPLTYWLYAATRRLFDDPLFGPRALSVLAGTLATGVIYGVTRRLGSAHAALAAAGLYAILPWAMLYDRLAYAEAWVNLAGAALVWASLRAFNREQARWADATLAGLVLGLGFFTKTTVLLLAPAPLLAAWLAGRDALIRNAPKVAAAYGIGCAFLGLNAAFTPEAPQIETTSAVFHKTHFFVPLSELLASPLGAFGENAPRLAEFLTSYLTMPGLLVVLGAGGLLLLRRSKPAVMLLLLSALPILAQAVLIDRSFSRYPFPHVWPLLVLVALAYDELSARPRSRWWRAGALGLTAVAFLISSLAVVRYPSERLAPADSAYFFGDGPNAGWGLPQTARHVRQAARSGDRVLVLTDPIWGTPADALFAYLNRRDGIRVAEAWWIDASPDNPIHPGAQVELWRSHYERVPDETLDLRDFDSIFYVTVTNYRPRAEVRRRQPGARLEASYPKPNGTQSLDLYRLR